MSEERYCKICGTELKEDEIDDICWDCQSAMISSGIV